MKILVVLALAGFAVATSAADVDLGDPLEVDEYFDEAGYPAGGEPSMVLESLEIPAGLPDGRWDFTLGLRGGFQSEEGGEFFEWRGAGTGAGTFVVERGAVFGAWAYDGNGVALFSAGGATASVPTPNSFDDGIVSSPDGALLEMDGSALDQVVRIRPLTFSCTIWEGALIDALALNLSTAGFDSALSGYFKAIRTSSGDEEGTAELHVALDVLTEDFRVFAAGAGDLDVRDFADGLGVLLSRAEALVEEVGASGSCTEASAATFASILGSQVASLVFDRVADGIESMRELFSISHAAVRSGVLGSGSTNPAVAEEVSLALEGAGQGVAQRMLADGSVSEAEGRELRTWIVLAAMLGWDDGLTDDQVGLVAES